MKSTDQLDQQPTLTNLTDLSLTPSSWNLTISTPSLVPLIITYRKYFFHTERTPTRISTSRLSSPIRSALSSTFPPSHYRTLSSRFFLTLMVETPSRFSFVLRLSKLSLPTNPAILSSFTPFHCTPALPELGQPRETGRVLLVLGIFFTTVW